MAACGTAKDIIKLVREKLIDDCPTQRYDDAFIRSRVNLALKMIYAIRPDEFPEKIIQVPLVAGANQFLPQNITSFEMLSTAYYDEKGKPVNCSDKAPTKSTNDFLDIYASRCASRVTSAQTGIAGTPEALCKEYVVSSYSFKRKDGGFFTVSPPVPVNGKKPFLNVLASACPECTPETDDEQLPCKLYSAIYEKTLVYMFDVESEDNQTQEKSARHEARFASIMGEMYRVDSRIGSGYFRGENGTGDPNVKRG